MKKLEPLRFRQAWRKLRYSPSFFLPPPVPLHGTGGGPGKAWLRDGGRRPTPTVHRLGVGPQIFFPARSGRRGG